MKTAKKTTKKIITLVLALALIFALCAPAFAKVPANQPSYNGVPYYIQGADSDYEMDGIFHVYLNIYSGIYDGNGPIDTVLDVTMGSANAVDQKYTVSQVLTAAHSQYPAYSFDVQSPYLNHESWMQGITYTNQGVSYTYEALPLHYSNILFPCGWMFRINGMIPFYIPSGENDPIGCLITDAYVTADDAIDLYYDNIYTQQLATKVYTCLYLGMDDEDATFCLLGSECYVPYGSSNWTVSNWAKVVTGNNTTIAIKVDGQLYNVSTSAQGIFYIPELSSGQHSIQVVSIPYALPGFTYTDGNNVTHNYQVPAIVGMYSRFSN